MLLQLAERRRASYSDKSEREKRPYQGNNDGMKEAVSLGIPKETAPIFLLMTDCNMKCDT